MKKVLLLAAALGFAGSSAALAADAVEQIPEAPMAVEAAVPSFTWTGGYVGLLGGYGGAMRMRPHRASAPAMISMVAAWAPSSAITGAMASGFVVGIEGDVNYDWNENSYAGGIDAGTDWSGSVRGRVGYAFDRALLFAAGGYTGTNGYVDTPIGDTSKTFHGWTLGAGVDYAFTDNVFGRLEYRYNDYGDKTIGGINADFDQHVVNVGIGVKF